MHQYLDAKFIENNPVPFALATVKELVGWLQPVFDATGLRGRAQG